MWSEYLNRELDSDQEHAIQLIQKSVQAHTDELKGLSLYRTTFMGSARTTPSVNMSQLRDGGIPTVVYVP